MDSSGERGTPAAVAAAAAGPEDEAAADEPPADAAAAGTGGGGDSDAHAADAEEEEAEAKRALLLTGFSIDAEEDPGAERADLTDGTAAAAAATEDAAADVEAEAEAEAAPASSIPTAAQCTSFGTRPLFSSKRTMITSSSVPSLRRASSSSASGALHSVCRPSGSRKRTVPVAGSRLTARTK